VDDTFPHENDPAGIPADRTLGPDATRFEDVSLNASAPYGRQSNLETAIPGR